MKSIASAVALSLAVLLLSAPATPEDLSSPAPAVSPSPVPGRIRVEVLSQLGKPISEAQVTLYELADPREEDPCSCGPWEKVVLAGVGPGVFEQAAASGTYRIEVTGDEWIGAVEEKVEVKAGETRQLKFSLEPGSVISGRVSDEDGNPLSDVEVSYSFSGFQNSTWFRSREREEITDSSGWFSFRNLSPGVYDLKISRTGYISTTIDDVATGTADLETALKKGFTIRGLLEGDLEDLESPVRLELEGVGIQSRRTFSRKVELGPEKNFEISDLKREIYSVRLQDGDYLSGWVRSVEALPPEEARPIILAVARGGSISGRVTATATGDPLPGVFLRLIPVGSKSGDFESSDPRGEFSFQGVEGGEYILKARLWQDPYSKFRQEKTIKIGPGQAIADIDLKLDAGREVIFSGAVFDEKGGPVEGAQVRIQFRSPGEKSYRQNHRARAVSDGLGNFTISVYLDSGGEVLIAADRAGYAPAEKKIEISPDQSTVSGVVLDLGYGVALEVEVGGEAAGRETIPSAIVALNTDWSEEREFRNYVNLKRLTDGGGRCRFENLAPGGYRIEVSKPGYSPLKEKVKLAAAEPVKTVSLVLQPGRTLLVRVEDENGQPVEGAALNVGKTASVMLRSTSEKNQTDSNGVVLLRDLPAVSLILGVAADGYVSIRRYRVDEDQGEVTVVMKPAGSIRGRFLTRAGRPLADLNIFSRKRDSGPFDFETSFFDTKKLGDGVFKLIALSPGAYDLTIRSEEMAAKKIEAVEVEAGRETDLGEVVLGLGSAITGRVFKRDDGSPLKGAWVRIAEPAEGIVSLFASADLTGSEGDFTLRGLNPGTFALTVTAKNYRPEKIAGVTVGSGEEKKIPDIHLAQLTAAEREELARRRNVIPSLGVRLGEGREGKEPPSSLVIEEVLPGTAAANSGLAAGDEIVKINGHSLSENPQEFLQGLMAAPGTEIKVTVKRGSTGREEEVDLTVDQWSMEDVIRQATQAD